MDLATLLLIRVPLELSIVLSSALAGVLGLLAALHLVLWPLGDLTELLSLPAASRRAAADRGLVDCRLAARSPCDHSLETWMWEIWDELVEDDGMVPEAPGGSFAQE